MCCKEKSDDIFICISKLDHVIWCVRYHLENKPTSIKGEFHSRCGKSMNDDQSYQVTHGGIANNTVMLQYGWMSRGLHHCVH